MQELEQAGIKPVPLAHLTETADAEHVDGDSAFMLTQLTCDSSTLPAHLVLLACLCLQTVDAMPPIAMNRCCILVIDTKRYFACEWHRRGGDSSTPFNA